MEELIPDIHEQILVRLDVKTLVVCKCVCKSWHSLISSPRFVETQLNISRNNDYTNNVIGRHRRVVIGRHDFGERNCYSHIVGSYNGHLCILDFRNNVLVANPSTREVKTLKSPKLPWINNKSSKPCWGFGYDSSTDDYKVIAGVLRSSSRPAIYFQMLSLKSNVWIHIGKVNVNSIICAFGALCIGTLCAGKLHWYVHDQNDSRIILSFDLSTDKFKEIPVSGDVRRGYKLLGIIKDCLCIHRCIYDSKWPARVWVMNEDDVKQPWKLTVYDHGLENQVLHLVKLLDYYPNKNIFCIDEVFLSNSGYYISSPIYVPSLVSPHAIGRPKRKRQAMLSGDRRERGRQRTR